MYLDLKKGWIEIIVGPMFSGKTEELIKRLTALKFAKQKFITFKPKIDTRWEKSNIRSRAGSTTIAKTITKASDAINLVDNNIYAVAFDEVQFFDDSIIETILYFAEKGKRVILAGLELDVFRKPFGNVPEIMAISEFVTKLKAICFICGGLASFSYRKKGNSKQQIEIGDKIYEARCRKDFN